MLVGGDTASVEEAVQAGAAVGGEFLSDLVLLPDVHPDVVAALGGRRRAGNGEALGVIETTTVASIIDAADGGRKGADVELAELRLGDGLGGRGYVLFYGTVADVEAAVEIGSARVASGRLVARRVISQLHAEMHDNLAADPRFRDRAGSIGEEGGR